MRLRRLAASAAILLLGPGLSSCGGNEDEDYCAVLKDEDKTLTSLSKQSSTPGADVLNPTEASMRRLRDAAPAEIRDEWQTVLNAWEAVVDTVAEAGVDAEDYRPGKTPPGLTPAEREKLSGVAIALTSQRVLDAARGIQDHAQQVCTIDLTL